MAASRSGGQLSNWLGRLKQFSVAYSEREVPMRAAALAYYAFFTLFPLLLLAMTVVGLLVNVNAGLAQTLRQSVVSGLQRAMPSANTSVNSAMTTLANNTTPLGIVGVVGLLWGVTGSVNAVGSAINRIFDPTAPMPGLWQRVKAGLAILAIGGLAILINLAGIVVPLVMTALGLTPPAAVWRILLQFAGAGTAFMLLYRILPTRPPSWRHAVQGGYVGGALFTLLQLGFSLYLRFVSFDRTYGAALAGVAILFVWLNLSATVFLAGALASANQRDHDADVRLPGERQRLGEPVERPAQAAD